MINTKDMTANGTQIRSAFSISPKICIKKALGPVGVYSAASKPLRGSCYQRPTSSPSRATRASTAIAQLPPEIEGGEQRIHVLEALFGRTREPAHDDFTMVTVVRA